MKTKYDYWANAKNELCKPTVLDGRLSAVRLADSAPDLLAALESLLDDADVCEVAGDDAIGHARSAIARARGE